MDMNVAIIGTGNVGKALAERLVQGGHRVILAARDEIKARRVASEVGASSAATASQAVRDAQVVILAVPFGAIDEVAEEIRLHVAGRIVVDATNPLKADYTGLATEGGPSAAEQLAARLPDAKVVKAFNTLFASIQQDPDVLGQAADVLFATDDDEARVVLGSLVASMGFRAVDAGPLEAARELESLAWLNISLQLRHGADWRSTFVLVGAPPASVAA
jgi:hypothetical protein